MEDSWLSRILWYSWAAFVGILFGYLTLVRTNNPVLTFAVGIGTYVILYLILFFAHYSLSKQRYKTKTEEKKEYSDEK